MRIKTIFNNNSLLAVNDNHEEQVLFGNGIGFKAKVNDVISMDKVEKVFIYKNHDEIDRLTNLLKNVPEDIVRLSFEIVEYCQNNSTIPLNDYLYVTLTDHLNYAFNAYENNHVNPNLIIWEIKRYYPKEYQLGIKALEYIEEEKGIKLNEHEAGHIALHLINAQINQLNDVNKNNVIKVTQKINDIMNLIKYSFGISLDVSSFEYERLVYHLKFFLSRINSEKKEVNGANKLLFDEVILKFPKEFECVCKIEKYLKQKMDIDEYLYLTMHIARVVHINK